MQAGIEGVVVTTLAVRSDVTAETEVAAAVDPTVETVGSLESMVDDVGTVGGAQPSGRPVPESFVGPGRVDVVGTPACVRHAAAHPRVSDRSGAVNIVPVAGDQPCPDPVLYATPEVAAPVACLAGSYARHVTARHGGLPSTPARPGTSRSRSSHRPVVR